MKREYGRDIPKRLKRAKRMILKDITVHHTILEIAAACDLDEFTLKTRFKELFGMGLFEFLTNERLTRAKEMLEKTEIPVAEIAPRCGYNQSTNLAAAFVRAYGVSPFAYRKEMKPPAPLRKEQVDRLRKVRNHILKNLRKHHHIDQLANDFGFNTVELKQGFKLLYGVGPYHFLQAERLKLAHQLLTTTNTSVHAIATECGYKFPSNLIAAYRRKYKVAPEEVRKANLRLSSK